MESSLLGKLSAVQHSLKAPKNQTNKFGGYNYRSCEDIMEAVKPLLFESGMTLVVKDEPIMVGERYYIKATATLYDVETGQSVEATAFAREEDSKKGMDASQITGSTSSYARKYCLNGLFCIDDTKDADTEAYGKQTGKTEKPKAKDNGTWGEIAKPISSPAPEVYCEECGKQIVPVETKSGKKYDVETLIKQSGQFYGKCLCYQCSVKAAKK